MLAIDKPCLTRIARALRTCASARGLAISHALALEAAAAALGFADINSATHYLATRCIVVGVPLKPCPLTQGLLSTMGKPTPAMVSNHIARMLASHAGYDIPSSCSGLLDLAGMHGIGERVLLELNQRNHDIARAERRIGRATEVADTLGLGLDGLLAERLDGLLAERVAQFTASLNQPVLDGEDREIEHMIRAELDIISNYQAMLAQCERATMVPPDVLLDVRPMAARLHLRLAARGRGNLELLDCIDLWGTAFASAVPGVDGIKRAASCLPASVIDAARAVATRWPGWSVVDETLVAMVLEASRRVGRWRAVDDTDAPTGDYVRAMLRVDTGTDGQAIEFNAAHYLMGADIEDLKNLSAIGWGGDHAADVVAHHCKGRAGYERLTQAMEHIKAHGRAYSVEVDGNAAMAWLELVRSDVWTELRGYNAAVERATKTLADTVGRVDTRLPTTPGHLVAELERIADCYLGDYQDFREHALALLDRASASGSHDEVWDNIAQIVRTPDVDDPDWIVSTCGEQVIMARMSRTVG